MSLTAQSALTQKAEAAAGYQLFQQHCSFCHGAQANGSTGLAPNLQGLGPGTVQLWLSAGWMPLKTPSAQPEAKYHAPPLHGVTSQQIWEAVRSGPQNMPQFGPKNITPSELNDIVKYVTQVIEHPSHPGGIALGGVGPVAEGFVGLFAGVGACMVAAYWVGDRTERDEEDDEEHEHSGDDPTLAPEGAHA